MLCDMHTYTRMHNVMYMQVVAQLQKYGACDKNDDAYTYICVTVKHSSNVLQMVHASLY